MLLIALGLGLALLVQESTRWKGFLRTSFLMPSALGLASASLLFYVLYSPFAGPFADLMDPWGVTFLGHAPRRAWSTVFLVVWRYAGFYMLLMLVGLQGISDDVYEAAAWTGDRGRRSAHHGAAAAPTLALTIVLCVTGSLLAFDQFYILTKGGPDNRRYDRPAHLQRGLPGAEHLGIAGARCRSSCCCARGHQRRPVRAFRRPEES